MEAAAVTAPLLPARDRTADASPSPRGADADLPQPVSLEGGKAGAPASSSADDDAGGAFDCNVCYDVAREPVVTMCGHLYCWPCLYR